jgi:hypothetical protein
MRLILSASLLLVSALASGCATGCSYGPSEYEDVPITVVAGEEISEQIVFSEDVGVYQSLTAEDMPAGLVLTLTDTSIDITGTVATPGTYELSVFAQVEEDEFCAEWSRFLVILTVE